MTAFTNQEQITLVLQSLLLGVGIGAVYDVLRAVRLAAHCGTGGTALFDALFWLIVLGGLFEFGLLAAAGQPRSFVVVSAAGGASLYFAALSGEVRAVLDRLTQGAAAVHRRGQELRRHCQTVARQRCKPEKILFWAKKFKKASFLFRGKGIK